MVPEQMAIRAIRHLMTERLGLEFPASRHEEFQSALEAARCGCGLASLEALFERLEDQDPEGAAWLLLRERLTVGETYFFRDEAQLAAIRDHVLRPMARTGSPRRLRLWSAGCASGEEAFTLAILAREALPEEQGWQVDILGTDLNPTALRRAQAACYRDWSFRGVDPAVRDRWFRRDQAGWSVCPDVRRMVRFMPHNLASGSFGPLSDDEGFDFILCRNVFIYFQQSARREVIDRLLNALKPTGALVTGHNEIDPAEAFLFQVEHLKDSMVLRPVPQAAALPAPAKAAPIPRPVPRSRKAEAAPRPEVPADPIEAARRALAEGDHDWALALAQGTRGADSIHLAGLALANLGRGGEAMALVQEGLARHPMEARFHYLHSLLASEQGQNEEALRALDRTLFLAPAHVAALMDRAGAHETRGRFREAVKDLDQALASLQGRAPEAPVDGLEPYRAGQVRDRCEELLDQCRVKAAG